MANLQKQSGEDLTGICRELVKALDESVERNLAEGILLSGGLDTSILAYLASQRVRLTAFTTALQNAPAPDIAYAALMANRFDLKHFVHCFNKEELYDAIRVVVKVMDSFDPMEVRNSVAVYVGLRYAKDTGVDTIMTGDGCDELFAGYGFLLGMETDRLNMELQKLWDVMHFSSVELAGFLKMEVKLPYLDLRFKKFAMKLNLGLKVRSESGQTWGKWILRKAFENKLPKEIVWRAKTPIEFGSGTTTLPDFFNSIVPDTEFNMKKSKYLDEDKVAIRDKEQLFYYEIYRSEIGVPYPIDPKGKVCPGCNSNMISTSTYCRKCGAYPV